MPAAKRRAQEVSFTISTSGRALARKIASRAVDLAKKYGRPHRGLLDFHMDIVATHANGNPLRLADLLAADDFNFMHDVFGIERHLNRETGRLENCFRPRFSACTKAA